MDGELVQFQLSYVLLNHGNELVGFFVVLEAQVQARGEEDVDFHDSFQELTV